MPLKKIVISAFIVIVLWQIISGNILYLLTVMQTTRGTPYVNHPQNELSKFISKVDYLSWLLGFRYVWNMFSPVDRYSWTVIATGITSDYQPVEIKLPYSSNTHNWKDSLFNYRESKLFQNMYGSRDLQNTYAQYICRNYQRQNITLDFIRYETTLVPLPGPYPSEAFNNRQSSRLAWPHRCI